jgi:hypothetical protein
MGVPNHQYSQGGLPQFLVPGKVAQPATDLSV